MKKIILLLAVIFIGQKINAQVNADCINAIPLCSNPSFTFYPTSGPGNVLDFTNSNAVSNPTNNPFPPNLGCLKSGELNPQWLLVTIANAGMLEFVFGAANSPNPQAGCYDWAMWPYSPATCSQILNNTLAPIRCNWNLTCSNGTGIASAANIAAIGGNAGDFEPPLAVNACQQFIICISNFTGVNTLVSFQSLGSASLTCNPNCNPNYAICAGSNATIVPVNYAALTNPTFSINPGATSNATGSFVVSPVVTTTYTTYITGLNSSNAVQTITATSVVSVSPQPAVAPTTTQSSCTSTVNAINLGLTFNPVNPAPNYTVNWSPIPNGILSTTQTTVTGGIAAGLYNATVTAAGGCSTTTSFSINPTPAPSVFNLVPGGTSFTITCAQPTVAINVNPASYTYSWTNGVSTPQTGSTGFFTTANQGTWTVTGTNPVSGCVSTQTFAVTQNQAIPSSTVGPVTQNITCNINSITTVTGTATSPTTNITHQWISPSGGTLTANTAVSLFVPGGPGTYTHCIVNNINGCSSCSTFSVVSSAGFPLYNVTSPQSFTIGCSTTSVALISVNNVTTFPTPGGSVTYTVLPPSFVGPTYTLGLPSTFTSNVPGTYTVIVKDMTNSCETKVQISVISNTAAPSLTASVANPTLSCNIPKTILQGLSSNPNVSYSWGFPGSPGQTPNDTLTVFTTTAVNSPTVATYTLTITDNLNLCKSTQTLTIYQDIKPPLASIAPTGTPVITCNTPTISLTNNSSSAPSIFFHPLAAVGFSWAGPPPQQPVQLNTNYTASTPGTYTLIVKDLNNGCVAPAYKTIIDNRIYPIVNTPNPPPPFILDCAAPGATIFPVLSGTTTGFTYSWAAVPTTSFSSYTSSLTIVNKPGVYRIYVTNPANGCVSNGNVEVVNGGINGDFIPSEYTGFAPLSVNFTNLSSSSSTTTGTSSITSVWSFGNGISQITTSASISPSTTYTNAGTYTVTMYVSKGTCLDTVSKVITVEMPSKLDVPNVFTPNGDGSNDVFFLKVANLTDITANIFDRWGNKVYESTSTKGNIAWDGTGMSGKDLPAGTYFYVIKATGKDGMAYEKKGNVSIYR